MDEVSVLQERIPSGIPQWPEWLVIPVCLVLVLVTALWDLSQPPSVTEGIPYVAVVLIASFSGRSRLTFLAGLLSIGLLIVAFYVSPQEEQTWASLINRSQTVAVIALLAGALIHRQRLMRQHQQALIQLRESVERLKVLQGMLPICSCCKKIKTDDGAWQQIESYIQAHSQAEFSHGICADCAREHYGEFWREDDSLPADADASP